MKMQVNKEKMRKVLAQEAGKADWISKYGSKRLRLMYAKGHPCERLYLQERVAKELGADWIVDTDWAECESSSPGASVECLEDFNCEAIMIPLPFANGHYAFKLL